MPSSKVQGTEFNEKWKELCGAQNWLSSGDMAAQARCKFCNVTFNVGLSGITSVRQHMATVKHKVSVISYN